MMIHKISNPFTK